jgi:hypothetical protein
MKGPGVETGQASTKISGTQERVVVNDVDQVEDSDGELRGRRSTRRATTAGREIQN